MPPDGFARHPASDGGLSERLGILFSRRDGGGLRFGFACDEGHTNAMGWVHGGLLMTFADQVLGLSVQDALNSDRVATVTLNCDFVSGVRPGSWIEGQARILRTTKTLVFVEGTIWRGETIVLNANGIWYRRPDAGDGQPSGDRTP
jgi:uncharacterized protein (TIGR00369 family)